LASRISIFAPAKINLYLHVTGKRADGFHLLDSLITFAEIGDHLSASPSDKLSLAIEGPFSPGLSSGPDNLVIKAAHLLAEFAGINAKATLTLTKNLPVASGIGGGSADAAATLHALAELWGISPAPSDLMLLAQQLGADVPVCVSGSPSFISGIGEEINPAPLLPSCWLVLINSNVAVSTPDVFQQFSGNFSEPHPFETSPGSYADLIELLTDRKNDLTQPAITVAPIIEAVLSALEETPDLGLARLSGSGATCFGLFANQTTAQNAAQILAHAHPDWWVQAAALQI